MLISQDVPYYVHVYKNRDAVLVAIDKEVSELRRANSLSLKVYLRLCWCSSAQRIDHGDGGGSSRGLPPATYPRITVSLPARAEQSMYCRHCISS